MHASPMVFKINKTETFLENLANNRKVYYRHTSKKEIITMSAFTKANEKIAKGVTEGMHKIENGVVGGYKKIEDAFTEKFLNEDGSMKTGKISTAVTEGYKKVESTIVEGFEKVTDKCVEKLFAKEGESVEDARKRLSGKQ